MDKDDREYSEQCKYLPHVVDNTLMRGVSDQHESLPSVHGEDDS